MKGQQLRKNAHAIALPYIPFASLGRKDAKTYFSWFIGQIPVRLLVLADAVKSVDAHATWRPDLMPSSLSSLTDWFRENLVTDSPSSEDKVLGIDALHRTKPQYRRAYILPDWVFTEQTWSIILDVGIYLGEVLRRSFPNLTWSLFTKSKRYIDYHQPVLTGYRGDASHWCNPVDLVYGVAVGFAKWNEKRDLHDTYMRWTQNA